MALDGPHYPLGINGGRLSELLLDEELGAVAMIGGQHRIRRATLQRHDPPARIHRKRIIAVALQDAADIADVVQQAGDDYARIV